MLAPKPSHGSRLPLAWAAAATVAAVLVVGSVAVSMLDPQPTAIAKAREANVGARGSVEGAACVAGLSDRASGVLADNADPRRRAVFAGGFGGGRGWPPVAARFCPDRVDGRPEPPLPRGPCRVARGAACRGNAGRGAGRAGGGRRCLADRARPLPRRSRTTSARLSTSTADASKRRASSTSMTKGSEFEKLVNLEGPAREVIRRNGEVRCYYPDAKVIRIEPRTFRNAFPSLSAAAAGRTDRLLQFPDGRARARRGHRNPGLGIRAQGRAALWPQVLGGPRVGAPREGPHRRRAERSHRAVCLHRDSDRGENRARDGESDMGSDAARTGRCVNWGRAAPNPRKPGGP